MTRSALTFALALAASPVMADIAHEERVIVSAACMPEGWQDRDREALATARLDPLLPAEEQRRIVYLAEPRNQPHVWYLIVDPSCLAPAPTPTPACSAYRATVMAWQALAAQECQIGAGQ